MMLLNCILVLTMCMATVEGAYKEQDCPSPCRCYEFLGQFGVYCNNTGINSIPKGLPLNTQLLDLSQNGIPIITSEPLNYLLNLETLAICRMGRTDQTVNLTDLKLPKLTAIDASSNSYTDIPQTFPDYIGMIFLYSNSIPVLKSDSFLRYPNLNTIELTSTGLHKIEPGTFDHTPKLSDVRITFNKLTDESFPPKCFANSAALSSIAMRFNHLTHVLPDLPPSITYLDYVGNRIKTLQAYAFNTTPNMQTMEFWEGQGYDLDISNITGHHQRHLTLIRGVTLNYCSPR